MTVAAGLARIRLVHPFPSLLNSALVFGLASLAGGTGLRAAVLALGMVGLQFCIGAVNDLVDAPLDAVGKPWKAIPAGLVSRRTATVIALVAGGGGLALAGIAGPASLAMAAAMLACGLAYDLWLKPTRLGWACFAVAFAILPVYAWHGATGELPPRWDFLVPLAALAGPMIQLSNALADLERDRRSGLTTLATRLERRSALVLVALLVAIIYVLAWLTLAPMTAAPVAPIALATVIALAGLALSAAKKPNLRELGWMVQATSVALLGYAWLSAVRLSP